MNSIIILSDEHSYQMMSYVSKKYVKTPNLDRLAGRSICFSNAYSNCPVCAPARASFFTGYYVNRLGTWDNATSYDGTVPGISHYLTRRGIDFAAFGKTHFHHQGAFNFSHEEYVGYMKSADIGCFFRDEYIQRIGAEERYQNICIRQGQTKDDKVIESAIEYMRQHLDGEWCVYVGLLDPHFPFQVKKEYWDYYNARVQEVPEEMLAPYSSLTDSLAQLSYYFVSDAVDNETKRRLLVGYSAAVAELDEHIGQLLNFLEESSLIEKTAILYTSDHGEQMGAHGLWWKCTMFEESTHIPLIFYVPQAEPKHVAQLVSLVDILPTILELHGINDLDIKVDGESLFSFVGNSKYKMHKDYVFSEYHGHGIKHAMYMIRYREYKYILYYNDTEQLFNLSKDSHENNNLIGTASLSKLEKNIIKTCRDRLYAVCNPEEVDRRAKQFQKTIKGGLGLEKYKNEKMDTVIHPSNIIGFPNINNFINYFKNV